MISIVITTILIVIGSYIIIDVSLKVEEDVGDVIVSITNNRDHDVLVRLEIDYKDSYIVTLSSTQTVNRLFRLSEGTHTFNLFVDGSFYSTCDRIIESDQDEPEPVEFIIL